MAEKPIELKTKLEVKYVHKASGDVIKFRTGYVTEIQVAAFNSFISHARESNYRRYDFAKLMDFRMDGWVIRLATCNDDGNFKATFSVSKINQIKS